MKKLLFLSACALTLSFNSFSQTPYKKLLFCKQYFTTESLLKLCMKHNNNEDNFNLFITEANKAAARTQTLLNDIEPTIKTKLTKEELENLKASVKLINDRTNESGSFDQSTMMKLTLWFQMAESKLNPIFTKLMK
jgi:hypothetical protein